VTSARRLGLAVGLTGAVLATFTASAASADEAACIAASETALTLRQQGKLHAALEKLAVCSDPACSSELREDCSQRVGAVNTAMPTLILAAKDGAGNDLFAVTVTVDGAPLVTSLDGRPLSLDPGPHTFHFEAPGASPQDKQLVLREGEHDRQVSVVLASPTPTTTIITTPVTSVTPTRSTWNTRKTLAVASGGVGLVGIGLGAVFGALAITDKNKQGANCGTPATCTNFAQASEDYRVAGNNATGSTIGFIAGGVLVAGGLVLWFTAPRRNPSASASASAPDGGRFGLAPSFDGRAPGLVFTGDL
jgi:hypothetical protein